MRPFIIILLVGVALASCKQESKTVEMAWNHAETIALDGINPIGIAQGQNGLWLSDGDHNRVVRIDEKGVIQQSIDSLDRPMHIDAQEKLIFIPQYGNDEILRYSIGSDMFDPFSSVLKTNDSLDAPAGIAVSGTEIAIADFYNNRIHYKSIGSQWTTFGKEGKADGDFYYPTDVQITEDKIWVADAYNNRVQAFDKQGNHLKTIGEDQNMNASTGIYVSNNTLFVTDFENDRVLVFDLDGTFKQALDTAIAKPTDMLVVDGKLYITNYKGSTLAVYEWSEKVENHHHEEAHDHHKHEDQ